MLQSEKILKYIRILLRNVSILCLQEVSEPILEEALNEALNHKYSKSTTGPEKYHFKARKRAK